MMVGREGPGRDTGSGGAGAGGRPMQQAFKMPLSPSSVTRNLEALFREWSNHHFEDYYMKSIIVFARDNYEHAKLIVTQIIRQVEQKYKENRDEPYINLIHEIIINVQGTYVQYFQEQLKYLFTLIWKKTKSSQDFIKLLKVFHIWYMFFDKSLLRSIYDELHLQKKETDFLTDEHWLKINNRKKEFKPSLKYIPAHLIRERKYICSEGKRNELEREFDLYYNNGQPSAVYGGGGRPPHHQDPRHYNAHHMNNNMRQNMDYNYHKMQQTHQQNRNNNSSNPQQAPDNAGVNELLGLLQSTDPPGGAPMHQQPVQGTGGVGMTSGIGGNVGGMPQQRIGSSTTMAEKHQQLIQKAGQVQGHEMGPRDMMGGQPNHTKMPLQHQVQSTPQSIQPPQQPLQTQPPQQTLHHQQQQPPQPSVAQQQFAASQGHHILKNGTNELESQQQQQKTTMPHDGGDVARPNAPNAPPYVEQKMPMPSQKQGGALDGSDPAKLQMNSGPLYNGNSNQIQQNQKYQQHQTQAVNDGQMTAGVPKSNANMLGVTAGMGQGPSDINQESNHNQQAVSGQTLTTSPYVVQKQQQQNNEQPSIPNQTQQQSQQQIHVVTNHNNNTSINTQNSSLLNNLQQQQRIQSQSQQQQLQHQQEQQQQLNQNGLPQQSAKMGHDGGPYGGGTNLAGNSGYGYRGNAGYGQGYPSQQSQHGQGHRFGQGSGGYQGSNPYMGGQGQNNRPPYEMSAERLQQIEPIVKGHGGFLSMLLDQYDRYQTSQRTICEDQIYQQYHRPLHGLLRQINNSYLSSGKVQLTIKNNIQFKRFGMILEQSPTQQLMAPSNAMGQQSMGNNGLQIPPQPRHLLNINTFKHALQTSGSTHHQILKEINVIAITQLYQSIKFQCSNCGLRFSRNMDLKVHLDQHFAENNEIRKRKKIGPSMYPNLAVAVDAGAVAPGGALVGASGANSQIGVHADNRPLFQSFQGWIQQGKGATGCMKAKSEVQANVELKNIVPYSKSEDCCFMCKEKLKIERDQCISSGNQDIQGASGQHPSQIDENCYFIDAKRIRISVRNKKTGALEKQEVTVHIDCFKQLEKIKSQNQKKKAQGGPQQQEQLRKRPQPNEVPPGSQINTESQPQLPAKRLRCEDQDVEAMKLKCTQLLSGFQNSSSA